MGLCRGRNPNEQNKYKYCNYILKQCLVCGIVGCDHGREGECTNQAFKVGLCLRCGTVGKYKTL